MWQSSNEATPNESRGLRNIIFSSKKESCADIYGIVRCYFYVQNKEVYNGQEK